MSWARNLLEDRNTHAHLSFSQDDCARSVGNLRPLEGFGRLCPVIWDGWLCWPPTSAGATIKQPCPDIYSFNTRQSAYKQCLRNGTWFGDWIPHLPHGWTNYSLCSSVDHVASLADHVTPYSALTGDPEGTVPALVVTSVLAGRLTLGNTTVSVAGEEMHAYFELPVDSVLGTAVHGVSAVCLLMAFVVWICLRLTDRLATKRHQLLTAAIFAAFLFHLIVLTTHFHAITVALTPDVPPTAEPPAVSGPRNELLQHGTHSAGTHADKATLTKGVSDKTRARRNAERTNAGLGGAYANSALGGAFVNPLAHAATGTVNSAGGRMRKGVNKASRETYPNADRNGTGHFAKRAADRAYAKGGSTGNSSGKGSSDTRLMYFKQTPGEKRVKRDEASDPLFVLPDYYQDEGGHDMNKGSNARVSAGDGSWMTLCEVGRAFYLLTDVAVYAFLFAMSLYYTLVVLGKTLNFKKLLYLFLLGAGLPAVFTIFSIFLYAFLSTPTGSGLKCVVASLDDEFHWMTTGPKLTCIVLSMCLMTVATYGFWRLHYPSLHASSETFYARQGIIKSLLFLFFGSLVELCFLVTQYQKMYGLTVYRPLWYASTALLGIKGLVLSLLCCFLDSEVVHGTCCPSSYYTASQARNCGNRADSWTRTKDNQGGRAEIRNDRLDSKEKAGSEQRDIELGDVAGKGDVQRKTDRSE